MPLADWFSTFCDNLVIRNVDDISYRYRRITRRLNTDFWETTSESSHSLYVGSYGRNTGIAGISDLGLLLEQKHSPILREQIGTRSAKLNADSPRRHAQDVTIPVMMFHGDTDPQVDVDHSRAMASALKAAGKPYRYVEFKGADHQIVPPEDRIQMLRLIEEFLSDNIGPSGTRAESTNPGTAR